ncbi:hypothetical protein LPJ71_009664, partial [Coemansia sp. S17]
VEKDLEAAGEKAAEGGAWESAEGAEGAAAAGAGNWESAEGADWDPENAAPAADWAAEGAANSGWTA